MKWLNDETAMHWLPKHLSNTNLQIFELVETHKEMKAMMTDSSLSISKSQLDLHKIMILVIYFYTDFRPSLQVNLWWTHLMDHCHIRW